ncbi:MAG: hypothetical protein LBF62_08270 [Tannerellaceae bacterium]|nr:hypothetical protein [Tannerellaceae bacterium]
MGVDPPASEVNPPGLEVDPQSLEIDPQSRRVDPQSRRVDPQSRRVDPQSLEIDPQSRRVDPQSLEVDPQSLEIDPQSLEVDPQNLEGRQAEPEGRQLFVFYSLSRMRRCFHAGGRDGADRARDCSGKPGRRPQGGGGLAAESPAPALQGGGCAQTFFLCPGRRGFFYVRVHAVYFSGR